ncbi:3-hydroxyisobutyrate dehydrogenase [Aestuariicella hydrocarbonica]|uniref:3-hydroxyisobutyrate dehydrogenase n=1 Tax=Pseudomaricurvus hydrocarbonicus TaxID=1470433 RepID=A0A9E5MPW4_9GAMM|nr:3-hydroxyisobutyrate dehydrogenase [Aestuariicella hydrocarbonica]NHO68153.1 3-hydroxyisobutyrate dehydrogenase [Aestuariicella hydrocarbonica]
MSKTVAFIGLGNMGGGMAANLVKAGFKVNAFDLMAANLKAAAEAGCTPVECAKAAVKGVDYVVSMLPNGAIVESVYLGASGNGDASEPLLDYIPKSALILDCSTVAPANSRRVGAEADKRGMQFVDAPVSGGVAAAAAGTLAFMVGGSESNFDAAKPVLNAMGANVFRAGDVGAGQVAKICNNMLLAIHMTGTAEALQLGMDNGLDPKVLSDIMLKSSGCNWSLEKYNPVPGVMDNVPSSNDYQPGFMVDLMLKDLSLAMEASVGSQSSIPMGTAARNLFNLHKNSGEEDKGLKDFSSIQQFYAKPAP